MITICDSCHGRGETPTGHSGMWGPVWGRCRACHGTGYTSGGTLSIDRIAVYAPTFRDARQFDAAVGRAFREGIEIVGIGESGMWLVHNPSNGATYHTSRTACTCKAGQAGRPCKHQARVIMALDVLHDTPGGTVAA